MDKLLKADFIWKAIYLDWIANVVLVKKIDGKWWICTDFIDLNKTRLKDSYLLSQIDQLVDTTSGHELLTFIDAFSDYNQIQIAPEDKEKIALLLTEVSFIIGLCPLA